MQLAVGEIISGKVTGITKFGAFVSLPEGKTGLVHISEVDQSYVSNIRDHLTEGQEVKVRIIAVDDNGRINLSIKKAQPRPTSERRPYSSNRSSGDRSQHQRSFGNSGSGKKYQRPVNGTYAARQPAKEMPASFEDKLKHFMQDSESRMADIRRNTDKKNGSRRRK
ncbi:MAG: S1 RNA-binding domain-containing protein [Eubacteriales bacterium]|nr:S1 RNA-binding domain-containing protein [Eubacteriales bacterium]